MQCEICGKSMENINYVNVDGAKLSVCNDCIKFGKVIDETSESFKKQDAHKLPLPYKENIILKIEKNKVEFQLKEDFYNLIKNAREKKGLKQDELAKLINERLSIISKLETGKITPDNKLVRKLEKFLEIELFEIIEEGPSKKIHKNAELTLGDIIMIRKRKNKG